MLTYWSSLYPVHIDTELNSFRARDRPIACQLDALRAAQIDAAMSRWPTKPANSTAPPALGVLPQSRPAFWLTLIYEAKPYGSNILTPERLRDVAKIEEIVKNHPGRSKFCLLGDPTSNGTRYCLPPKSLLSAAPYLREQAEKQLGIRVAGLDDASLLSQALYYCRPLDSIIYSLYYSLYSAIRHYFFWAPS